MQTMSWWEWFIWWFVLLLILVPGWLMPALIAFVDRHRDYDDETTWHRVPRSGWILFTAIIGWLVLWIIGTIFSWGTIPAAILLLAAILVWIFGRNRGNLRKRAKALTAVLVLALIAEAAYMLAPVVEHWVAKSRQGQQVTLSDGDWNCSYPNDQNHMEFRCRYTGKLKPPDTLFEWSASTVSVPTAPPGYQPASIAPYLANEVNIPVSYPGTYKIGLWLKTEDGQARSADDPSTKMFTAEDVRVAEPTPSPTPVADCNQLQEGSWRLQALEPDDQKFREGPDVVYPSKEAAEQEFVAFVERIKVDPDNLKDAVATYLQYNDDRNQYVQSDTDPNTGCADGFAISRYRELVDGASQIVKVLDVVVDGASYGSSGQQSEAHQTGQVSVRTSAPPPAATTSQTTTQSSAASPAHPPTNPVPATPPLPPSGTQTGSSGRSGSTVQAVTPSTPAPASVPTLAPVPVPTPVPAPAPSPPPVPQVEPAPDVPENGSPVGTADGVGSAPAGGTVSPG